MLKRRSGIKIEPESLFKLLDGIGDHFRTYYEDAQEHFPAALVKLSNGQKIGSLNRISDIKTDLLTAIRNIRSSDVTNLVSQLDKDAPYTYQKLRTRHDLYRSVPDNLLEEREDLRRTGYVVMGHAQEARRNEPHGLDGHIARVLMGDRDFYRSSNYMSHIEKVFQNARAISERQAEYLNLPTLYDANLLEFVPDIKGEDYHKLLDTLLEVAITARNVALENQRHDEELLPLPDFTISQGKALIHLVMALCPIPDERYNVHLLEKIPSMCMGNIATIRFSENPFTLVETAFHEGLGHLVYRYNSDNFGGIGGFHLDEARALSLERFFLRESSVMSRLSSMMTAAYGEEHDAFEPDNLLKHATSVRTDISDRTASDDLTYIIQEVIRGKTEILVMNGELNVRDMPDFMAAETKRAFGVERLNGYHIMRETFQWPLCMHGHMAAYPTGFVIAANLHQAAKAKLGADFSNMTEGLDSPYFEFMAQNVDRQGAQISPQEIVHQATGKDLLDITIVEELFAQKAGKEKRHSNEGAECRSQELEL